MMKKYILDLRVCSVEPVGGRCVLLRLTDDKPLPEMCPGQFVEVRIDHTPSTLLRRPISVCFVDRESNELWLLVAAVGDGTRHLAALKAGDVLNCVLPLGNGWMAIQIPPKRGTFLRSPKVRLPFRGGLVGLPCSLAEE